MSPARYTCLSVLMTACGAYCGRHLVSGRELYLRVLRGFLFLPAIMFLAPRSGQAEPWPRGLVLPLAAVALTLAGRSVVRRLLMDSDAFRRRTAFGKAFARTSTKN